VTLHRVIIGSAESMSEIEDESIQLVVTSPPYFNAPFDYKDLFNSYGHYLKLLKKVAGELFRVVAKGRIVALNIDDMLVDGEKFPIVADATKIFREAGFTYRDRIIWKKPDGYLRISRRSGVILQNPYPMYFYPDNLLESILFFQKGKFDYKSIDKNIREESKIDKAEFQKNKWYSTLWEITNVLPNSKLEKDIAAFPDELPYRIIKLFSYKGETVLDPFLGSGTTMKIARRLGRNSVGFEVKEELISIIRKKVGIEQKMIIGDEDDKISFLIRGKQREVVMELIDIAEGINVLDIEAEITGITYKYSLCKKLNEYSENQIKNGMPRDATFYLNIDGEKVAVSYWVTPKRTRSYPYSRVYDSLNFSGKKITVIPVIKEEGYGGDRDYIQWDTVSLMNLLDVYVVIGYYKDASMNKRSDNTITDQIYDMDYVLNEIRGILRYQSGALHWNLAQIDKLQEIGNKAIDSYEGIFKKYGIRMHNVEMARERINQVMYDKKQFMNFSRNLAREAQNREVQTVQPKELIMLGDKARISIKNYIGGIYYFTADEARISGEHLYLVEAKNTVSGGLPSTSDIKDGLFKMVLFSNLSKVKVNNVEYPKQAILKLTGNVEKLTDNENSILNKVKGEAMDNGFNVILNDKWLV